MFRNKNADPRTRPLAASTFAALCLLAGCSSQYEDKPLVENNDHSITCKTTIELAQDQPNGSYKGIIIRAIVFGTKSRQDGIKISLVDDKLKPTGWRIENEVGISTNIPKDPDPKVVKAVSSVAIISPSANDPRVDVYTVCDPTNIPTLSIP